MPSIADAVQVEATDPSGRYQAGRSIDEDGEVHLLQWRNGALTDLTGGLYNVWARDVNARGEIVGYGSESGPGDYSGWRYSEGEFTDLRIRRPYTDAEPVAINDAGQVAGRLDDPNPETGGSIPVVWSVDNQLTVLTVPSGWGNARVEDIDEDGTVLGNVRSSGKTAPVVWYPDGTYRLLAGPRTDVSTEAASIRSGKVAGFQQDGVRPSIFLWDAHTGEATRLPVTGYPHAVNARGSVIGVLMGSAWGEILQAGATEPRPLGSILEKGYLTEDDVVYGNIFRPGTGRTYPQRWDCRD